MTSRRIQTRYRYAGRGGPLPWYDSETPFDPASDESWEQVAATPPKDMCPDTMDRARKFIKRGTTPPPKRTRKPQPAEGAGNEG